MILPETSPDLAEEDMLPEATMVDTQKVAADLKQWIKANCRGCDYLLAHAEDGVIWGRFDHTSGAAELVMAAEAFPQRHLAELRIETLWQCRLFGPKAEVLLWREGDRWLARRLEDGDHPQHLIIDEAQMLWGDHVEARNKGFTLLADGSEGLRHAVALDVSEEAFTVTSNPRPVRLHIRHYITYDRDGNARIGLSRLFDLTK